jgi:energy-coupling factor transporter ATP-binding protein EcfA2
MFGRSRVVEFTGPPGGGKSTLAERCAQVLRERGLRIPERDEIRALHLRHGWIGRLAGSQVHERDVAGQRLEYFKEVETPLLLRRFRLFHPRAWRRWREAVADVRERDTASAEMLERWVERSVLTWLMLHAQRRRMDLFLWEEGIAHRAVNLFAHPDAPLDEARLAAFLRAWPFPNALVHVDADVDACVERLAERGLPERLSDCTPEQVRSFVERGARVARAIAAEARRRRLPVFEIENRADSAQAFLASEACNALPDALADALRARPRSAA